MKSEEKQLLQNFRALNEAERQTLLDFAAFLRSRSQESAEPVPEPELIQPKEDESVVGAIKRLSASYPMLSRSKMLNETSVLMTQHVMHGREKGEVIEELEQVFARHYELLVTSKDDKA